MPGRQQTGSAPGQPSNALTDSLIVDETGPQGVIPACSRCKHGMLAHGRRLPQTLEMGLNESIILLDKSFTVTAVAAIAAAALVFLLLRSFARRRLRLPRGPRPRPARLGIVDAFDLGRRRQLVIVRRDNVEHLLMIGGPNDLVIESQFVRADNREPRFFREAKPRERELREREPQESQEDMPHVSGPALPLPAQPKGPRSSAYAAQEDLAGEPAPGPVPSFLSTILGARRPVAVSRGVQHSAPPNEFASFAEPRMLGGALSNPAERPPRSAASWLLRPPGPRPAAEMPAQARARDRTSSGFLRDKAPERAPAPPVPASQGAGPVAVTGARPAAAPAPDPDGRPPVSPGSLEEELARNLGRARGQANPQ